MEQLNHVRPFHVLLKHESPIVLTLPLLWINQENICRFKECFEDERIIYLVLEVSAKFPRIYSRVHEDADVYLTR